MAGPSSSAQGHAQTREPRAEPDFGPEDMDRLYEMQSRIPAGERGNFYGITEALDGGRLHQGNTITGTMPGPIRRHTFAVTRVGRGAFVQQGDTYQHGEPEARAPSAMREAAMMRNTRRPEFSTLNRSTTIPVENPSTRAPLTYALPRVEEMPSVGLTEEHVAELVERRILR